MSAPGNRPQDQRICAAAAGIPDEAVPHGLDPLPIPDCDEEAGDGVAAALVAVTDAATREASDVAGVASEGGSETAGREGIDAVFGEIPDFDAVDSTDTGGPGWRGIRRADGLVTAAQLLAELALDRRLTLGLRRALREGRPVVVFVTVPSPAWVKPVEEAVAGAGGRKLRCIAQPTRPKPSASRDPDREASEWLAEGRAIVAITPDVAGLSAVLAAAVDHTIDLPPLDAALVNRAVGLWCGRRARMPVTPADLAGLDLLDVAAALRPGARPAACVARLRRASQARIGLPADTAVTPLAELTGYGPAHDWAVQLVEDIARVRRGEMKASLLEGAVFFGIPGTGKTTLARSIAQAAGVPFVETSVGEWFSGSSGNLDGVIKAAAQFFDALSVAAKVSGTAIGIADECEALPNRARLSDRGADWWLPLITFCLIRIEALRRAGIVLLAATNDLSRVDAALLRPGRFDRQFEILPPDETARLGILRAHLGEELRAIDLTPVARLTPGATGAVLAGGVRAARRRAQAEARDLALDDLLFELAPADGRSPAQLHAAALHEAAHAVIAHRLGLTVVQVTIQAGDGHGGVTTIRFTDPTPDRAALERRVVMLLAGRAADVVLGAGATAGASADLREATQLLAALHASLGLGATLRALVDEGHAAALLRDDAALAGLVEADLQRLWRIAQARVAADRGAILALVAALLARRVVTGAEVVALAAAHSPRVRVKASRGRPPAPCVLPASLSPSG